MRRLALLFAAIGTVAIGCMVPGNVERPASGTGGAGGSAGDHAGNAVGGTDARKSIDLGPSDETADASAAATGDGNAVDATPSIGGDAQTACAPAEGAVAIDVTDLKVTNAAGATPVKGDELLLTVSLVNSGAKGSRVTVTPLVTSKRFIDWTSVPFTSVEAVVCPGNSTLAIKGGPFFSDAKKTKHYALGRGDYVVSGVTIAATGQTANTDTTFTGAAFTVGASNAILVPILYDQRYFAGIDGGVTATGTPEQYLIKTYTRANEIFTPSGTDPDGPGTYQKFAGGFEEMMKTRHRFKSFPGFVTNATDGLGWCERMTAYAKKVLGLTADWTGAGTLPERHGFDYLIGLTPDMGGGVTCGWLDVQVSSFINHDIDRQQIIAIHETGHVFGSPHCDDVGDGAGGTLQGYVMCSGEKHAHYPGAFVWHSKSIATMKPHWD